MKSAVAFRTVSELMFQFERSPLMNPEMMTNNNTRMLMAVKTLLTVVDSWTPKASKPSEEETGKGDTTAD